MEQSEIIEGNKLIAEFIDLTPHNLFPDELQAPDPFGWMAVNVNVNSDYAKEDREFESFDKFFKFNSSWNWLMPVVEKIETIETEQDGHFGVFISSNTCMIQGTKLYLALKKAPNTYGFVYMSDPNAIFPTKLESTWYNVIEFIKWYNKQKQ